MKNFVHSVLSRGIRASLSAMQPQETANAPPADPQAPPPVITMQGSAASPIVLAAPHAGRYYPDWFVETARQPLDDLRSGEDSFTELLAQPAHALGPALVHATFPRVLCDPNRAAWDLDPRMFHGPIPPFIRPTERGLAGLGSIPRITGSHRAIYRSRLPFNEAARRIATYWMPYHTTLASLLRSTHQQHGQCLLLDLHSMPDTAEIGTADFVLGDRHGTACASAIMDRAEQTLRALGYSTARNTPYAGGYITQQYGHPPKNCHALQIEIRRSLYMTEATHTPHDGFEPLAQGLAVLVARLLEQMS